jgi:DNA-3-methyladenine glycosylase II
MLGVCVDLAEFYRITAPDPKLGPLVEQFRGVKPPRFPSLFETLVNAIACQQVTLTLGIRLLNRLTGTWGPAVHERCSSPHAFPRPRDLALLDPDMLRSLGFSHQKARALVELASAVAGESFHLDEITGLDEEASVARLCKLRGVGRWTAEYMLLRGLGRLQVFPGDDVGARKNLERWLGLAESLDYEGVRRNIAPWKSHGGLIYFHLLLKRLTELGYL